MTPIHFGLSRNFIGRNEMSCAAAIIEIVQIAKQSLICFPNMSAGADAASDGLRGPRQFSRKVLELQRTRYF